MGKSAFLPISYGDVLETIRFLFDSLLQKKLVEALLVPLELPSRDNVVPTIVSHPDKLQAANPLAPVMPLNSARLVSVITVVSPSPKRLGVVLRPCELKALIELVKLKQASLENLLLIGLDCLGTYSVSDYGRLAKEIPSPVKDLLNKFREGKESNLLRKACQVCETPTPMGADLVIGLIGVDFDKGILLEANTEAGEKVINDLALKEGVEEGRESALSKLVSKRVERRNQLFEQTRKDAYGLEKLMALFARCTNCRNCKAACPLCYCRECLFDSPEFEFEAEKYLTWAQRRGALRMPAGTLLFHLTRLNHMVISCVGCGLCSEACPNDIPVFDIFRLVGSQVQKIFDYVPGRSLDEEIPLTTFREAELAEIGI